MNIDQKYVELINADIDGEISDAERAELDAYTAGNPQAQELRTELRALCEKLDAVEPLEPPAHLKYAIMDNLGPAVTKRAPAPAWWQQIFALPVFRHAVAFAAGVFMTIALVDSNQLSDQAFDDVTGLVGTISDEGLVIPSDQIIKVNKTSVAGTVSTHHTGSLTVIDFNMSTADKVEIIADFSGRDVWFRGFAQLENDGTEIKAETGHVTMTMSGRNRYAMYLHHSSNTDSNMSLKFYASGVLVHEADLMLRAPGSSRGSVE